MSFCAPVTIDVSAFHVHIRVRVRLHAAMQHAATEKHDLASVAIVTAEGVLAFAVLLSSPPPFTACLSQH